jgi:large subunit ribosomal protein L29
MNENHASKLRELPRAEVELKLQDLQIELENLRFRAALKQEGNPLRIRQLRRDIARIHTLLDEDARGLRRLASATAHKL